MNRIIETAFPGKLIRKANVHYINVPSTVVERMELHEGEYLNVVITFPKREKATNTEDTKTE